MDMIREYNSIIDSLIQKLELLRSSGVSDIYTAKKPGAATGPAGTVASGLGSLRAEAASCQRCARAASRKKAVFGSGDQASELVFLGGFPDEADEIAGAPFSLRSGSGDQLSRIIKYMGFERGGLYITLAVKCGAGSSSRLPSKEEAEACRDLLLRELSCLSPKVIIALGPVAASSILGSDDIKALRGVFHDFNGIKVMPTHDPATLLKRPELKKETLQDINLVIEELRKKPGP